MFSAIQRDTSNILVKVLYEYSKEKDLLRNKHEIVLNYINEQKDPLTLDLDEIYNKINDNFINLSLKIFSFILLSHLQIIKNNL